MSHDIYESTLSGRYPSEEMKKLWSANRRIRTWRQFWIWLAEVEQELGLSISNAQISQMKEQIENINFASAAAHEKRIRHDVMAHITAYGEVAPLAAPIIHLGATSCYVTDNTDLFLIREALTLVCQKIACVIDRLSAFAHKNRALATLAFTHIQPAQPTTVGMRASLWLFDLYMDLKRLEKLRDTLPLLGSRGATGTAASFLELFHGDHGKVRQLNQLITERAGFLEFVPVSGQTYTRKIDVEVVQALVSFAASASKCALDLRILQSRKEMEEPFEKDQVGSSAMAYKRNPMRSERINGLARLLIAQESVAVDILKSQIFERTLDDSSSRRTMLPESFLLADSILKIYQNVVEGLVVYPAVIRKNLMAEVPFMCTENIIMAAVEHGASRQECHERIRVHAQKAGDRVKLEGLDNDLLERVMNDMYFESIIPLLPSIVNPDALIGRAPQQVDEFLPLCQAAIAPYRDYLMGKSELPV